ncbi:hypothetical protein JOM56_004599 [Amanita muscaria]
MVHHVYHKVTPDVFTNTRLSSMLDTSKPSQDIIADPESKHTSLPALAGHHLDEMFKSSAYLWETLSDPQMGKSDEPGHAAIGKALSNGKGIFDYFAQPDQKYRQKRFDIAMRASQSFFFTQDFLTRCLQDVFNKKAPDFHRAQALYQVFIEIASELETTSQFNAVMTRHIVNPVPYHTRNHAPYLMQNRALFHMWILAPYRISSSRPNHAHFHMRNHTRVISYTSTLALFHTLSLARSHTMNPAHFHMLNPVRSIISQLNQQRLP